MRKSLKTLLNILALVLVAPFGLLVKLEALCFKDKEFIFNIFAQTMSLFPGLPGALLRRAFYIWSLDKCSYHCHIGFGTIFSHRTSVIEDYVYIGNYALIGSAHLGAGSLVGSRCSILSGKELHTRNTDGSWSPFSADKVDQITIGENVWVGEGAIIIADLGKGCMVGAGSVVSSPVKPNIMVSGNPVRFVKKLEEEEVNQTSTEPSQTRVVANDKPLAEAH